MVAEYLKVGEVIEVTSYYDTTGMGNENASFESMWSQDQAMLCFRSKGGAAFNAGIGRQPVWAGYADDYVMDSYYNPETRTDIVRAREYRGETLIKEYGFLFNDVLA